MLCLAAFGLSATMASVVIRSPAIDAAFCSAALASPDLADALALTFAYPVAAQDHRWQTTGKPRHQYQYDPFQRAWTGRV
jgi:hypothetical protein